jgi:hypothetical protein
MGLNLSNLETVLQNKVDGLTSSSTDKDVLLTSKSIEAATADVTVAGIIAEGTTQTAAAATQATNAAASASTATTQAGIATTKAGEAATSKTGADTAKTAAESAKASSETAETNALSSKNSAATSASTATTQAGISSTKAGEASTSASAAANSASGAASAATTAVNAVIDTAPANLNTLNELAAALGDDANYAATTTTALGNRYTKTETDSKIVALSPPATKAHVESLGIAASSITGALPAISGANLLGILRHTTAASAPAVGAAGTLYFNTDTSVLSVSDGTEWAPVYSPPLTFKFMQASNSSWWAGTLSADGLSWTHTPGTNRSYGAIIVDHVFTEDFEVIIESDGTSHSGGVAYKAGASLSDFDGYSADPAGAYMGNATVWNISSYGSYSFATSYYPNGLYTGGANSHNWLRYARTGASVVLQTGQSASGPWTNYQSFSSTAGILVGYGTAGSAYAPTNLISVTGK